MDNDIIKIHLFSTTDVHNRFDTYDYAANEVQTKGGMTQISNFISEFRRKNSNVILMDCGDMAQDNCATLFIDSDKQDPMFKALNHIKYDSWTIGNHEFNYGPKFLKKFISEPDCPVLCGNIFDEKGERLGSPYIIKNVNGVRVAILGMTTPNCKVWDGPKYPNYTFKSPLDECKIAIKEIKDNNLADIIVGAMHLGFTKELQYGDNVTDIVAKCPEFDAIMCGHMHVQIDGEVIGDNKTIVSEAGKFGEVIAHITLDVKKDENNHIEIVNKHSELIPMKNRDVDSSLDMELKYYHDKGKEESEKVIGVLKGGPLADKDEVKGIPELHIKDSAMIHILNDTIIHYALPHLPDNRKFVSGMHLLSVTSNVFPGDIKKCYLTQIYRYDNFIYIIKLSGKQIKTIMEWSADYYNLFKPNDVSISFNIKRENYSYLMFDNVNYDIDITKPTGNRIKNLVFKDGTPFCDNEDYYFITGSYIKDTFLDTKIFPNDDSFEVLYSSESEDIPCVRELIGEYIEKVKNGVITNEFKPNWKIIGVNYDEDYRKQFVDLVNKGKITIPETGSDKHNNPKTFTKSDVDEITKNI